MSEENPNSNILNVLEKERIEDLAIRNPKKFQDLKDIRLTQQLSQMIGKRKKITNHKVDDKKEHEKISGIVNKDGIVLYGSISTEGPIEKIILALDTYKVLNTTQIKSKTGLSWISVIRTMKLFRDKKIVKIKTKQDRKNNEKIYLLKRDRAIFFVNRLVDLKFPLWTNNIKKTRNITRRKMKRFPQGWKEMEINISKNGQKKFNITKSRIKIKELPAKIALSIVNEYVESSYCIECFERGDIIEIRWLDENTTFCDKCGNEAQAPELALNNKDPLIKRILWDIDKKIYQIKNKKVK